MVIPVSSWFGQLSHNPGRLISREERKSTNIFTQEYVHTIYTYKHIYNIQVYIDIVTNFVITKLHLFDREKLQNKFEIYLQV